MLNRLNKDSVNAFLNARKAKRFTLNDPVLESVQSIIASVAERGDAALKEWTLKLDGVKLETFNVAHPALKAAYDQLDEALKNALINAKASIENYHQKQAYAPLVDIQETMERVQKITPIETVGIYIPGGTARYPSSVLMNAIPAQVAGVKRIIMVTPPHPEGIDPSVLAAAYLCGVEEVYQIGGAQAIAALALGTSSIPSVDKIVGPGNIYVATAKQQLSSMVGIDHFAGPSEVLIIADDSVDPRWIAADLMAQAEHDPKAQAIVISEDEWVLDAVDQTLQTEVDQRQRSDIIKASLQDFGAAIHLAGDAMYDVINQIAPEHLEICTKDPKKHLPFIKNAGSIFVGPYTPEAIGDYIAGPNHTLPTSGTARYASGLSTYDFLKRTSIVTFKKAAFEAVYDDVVRIADQEQLDAHAYSMRIRKETV